MQILLDLFKNSDSEFDKIEIIQYITQSNASILYSAEELASVYFQKLNTDKLIELCDIR